MKNQKIAGLQLFRGIAACAFVLICAYSRGHRLWPAAHSVFDSFAGLDTFINPGVDFFLVLSGFLVTHFYSSKMGVESSAAAFMLRRIVRVVPLYWLLSLFWLMLMVLAPRFFSHQKEIEWRWVLGSFAFVPWPQSDGAISPIISTALPLYYEMYFYMLFAAALALRKGLQYLIVLLLISVAVGYFAKPEQWWLDIPTCYMLGDFLLGIAVAIVARYTVSRRSGFACFAMGIILLTYTSFHDLLELRALLWGLPCALIILGVIWISSQLENRTAKALVLIGDASYSLFLIPVFVLPCISITMKPLGAVSQLDLPVAFMWIITCVCGVACWWLVERPISKFFNSNLRIVAST